MNFKREVSQRIASSPYVKLKKGKYKLTAKIKNIGNFTKLEMYAKTIGKILKYNVINENSNWTTIEIENIDIKNEFVEIGFLADGLANAYCYVDDITLLKKE